MVSKTKTLSLPKFPELVVGKSSRRMTKHYCNLALWLEADELAVINWLTYQLRADNTFMYSTRLLEQYKSAAEAASKVYLINDVYAELKYTRFVLKRLISLGLIMETSTRNKFMLNPLLSYEPEIVNRKQYAEVCKKYQSLSPDKVVEFTDHFTTLVSKFLESKKKNYKYGSKA